MDWLILCVAGLLETAWACTMKLSHGFSRLWPSVLTIVLMITSFALLSLAMRRLPLGTAYAVWTGIGAAGAVIAGILFLGESADVRRLLCVALIVSGIIGLRMAS